MHFHKHPHPANFEFPAKIGPTGVFKTRKGTCQAKLRAAVNDIYHVQITGHGWKTNESETKLRFTKGRKGLEGAHTRLSMRADGSLVLKNKEGKALLSTPPKRFFGRSGGASIFEFTKEPGDQFYGMGEKWSGFEHSGKHAKFWNTDVWADFHSESYVHGKPAPDPVYVSIPYLILKRGNTYTGLLLDNPHATFIFTGHRNSVAGQMELDGKGGVFQLGVEEGQPNLYIIHGPSLAALTRKLQTLVGTTPRPHARALGYHQCRWGYQSDADLRELDAKFREHGIPVDGLWLDIDYMDRYKVFTFAKKNFPAPARTFARLLKKGRWIVPIIDPGVKLETGYGVYERGLRARAFCENPQGGEYVGLVWPGETVFPDFSIGSARAWRAREVGGFARLGVHAAWLDMNDPATGRVDNHGMLFDHGRKSHTSYHNQYALGMARATQEGFLKAHPGERPFLLSRSGCTGSNRYAAIWTGDNYSNYHHLKNSIPTTLNLALSGIPFNGPDAGGFGGNTTPELMRDWFKAGFLFPFFRNHTITRSRQQEPWAFDKKTSAVLRRYIRLRYRFRPYLYNLFIEQERTGEAILRPLFYDFDDSAALPLGLVDDQFLVGPHVMQAPFLMEKQKTRDVVLPGAGQWYDVAENRWIDGGQKITAKANLADTPVYIRNGSILPLARLEPGENTFNAKRIDFHVYLSGDGEVKTRYVFDDGATFDYQRGKYSGVEISARQSGNMLSIEVVNLSAGFGRGDFTFTAVNRFDRVEINGKTARRISSQGVPLGPAKTFTWQ